MHCCKLKPHCLPQAKGIQFQQRRVVQNINYSKSGCAFFSACSSGMAMEVIQFYSVSFCWVCSDMFCCISINIVAYEVLSARGKPISIVTSSENFNCIVCLIVPFVWLLHELCTLCKLHYQRTANFIIPFTIIPHL